MRPYKFGIVEKQFEYRGHDCLVVFTHWGCQKRLRFCNRKQRLYRLRYRLSLRFVFFRETTLRLRAKGEILYRIRLRALLRRSRLRYGLIDAETRDQRKEDFSYLQGGGVWGLEYVEDQCKYIVDQLEGESK